MPPCELTLIVAATSKMGIGLNGTLPWTGLKKEMAYFARVTKRASPGTQNIVIMGRKTWDSIPPKFRPLKDRQNVVITREAPSDEVTILSEHTKAPSISLALAHLSQQRPESRVFVIGGGQIYKAVLERKEARRILLTRVLGDFECDTFFPVVLGQDGNADGWVRRGKEDLDSWVGEDTGGEKEEGGVRYVFEMWERTD